MAIVNGTSQLVVMVGTMPGLALALINDQVDVDGYVIRRCQPRARALGRALTVDRSARLLLGAGLDEEAQTYLLQIARIASPGLRVAVIGPEHDLEMCDRWIRRCCVVYLSQETSTDRLLRVLGMAGECSVSLIDACFHKARLLQYVQPPAPLTRRERQVLRLISAGLRNGEVAHELNVSQRTAEFHVRNLLEKLGARNRVEAVERGRLLEF
jgi:DNA-binding NarL/FixJ family response regulator